MPLGTELGLGSGDIALDGDPAPSPPKRDAAGPLFGNCLLCPNGWMDQGATWYKGRPWPGPYCVRAGPSPQKGAQLRLFGPCQLWPNSCMDEDATWYGARPWPRRHCNRWGTSSLLKGTEPPLFGRCLCAQTAGWIKMPLGMKVGLGPSHIVLDRGTAPTQFSAHVYCGHTVAHVTAEHLLLYLQIVK